MARYASPWDRRLKLSTALFVLVAGGLAAWIASMEAGDAEAMPAPLALVPVLLAAIGALAWALAPRGFSVQAGRVRVERLLLPVEIPLREIRAVEALPDGALGGSVRVWGAGGVFGYYGRFWSRRLGRYRLYATRTTGLVRLGTAEGSWVLSPEPAVRFVEEVLAHAPAARPQAPAGGGAARPAPRTWIVPVALAAAVAAAVAAVAAGSWAWAPRSASVVGGEVVVEREWAGPERIPLASIQEVRLLGREDFRGWRRVSGVARRTVGYGRYRSDALGTFQLYAWRRGGYVLLATGEGKVVLTPDDCGTFLAQVRAGMGPAAPPR